jgi:hypothetical protein
MTDHSHEISESFFSSPILNTPYDYPQHWRHRRFTDIRPFFCQVEVVETPRRRRRRWTPTGCRR